MMKATLSYHAFARVINRLTMHPETLIALINHDLAINIGQENKSNRVHKLFYSHRDQMCFVAIQDIKTGTIITLLPIDYHNNIAWIVSLESQNQAKRLMLQGHHFSVTDSPKIKQSDTPASVFQISGRVTDDYGCFDILPALKGTGIPDVTQERVVPHDDTLVSVADGITAPFTSQTSPACPAVEKLLHSRFLAGFSR